PPGSAPVEVTGRLEDDRNSGVGAAQVAQGHDPPPVRRVDDPGAAAGGPLEHGEVAGVPVQDRSVRQEPELTHVWLHAPGLQPVQAGRIDDGQRGDAVASGPGHIPQLAEVDALAEILEHHGETGGSAVGIFHLPDTRDRLAHGAAPWPSIEWSWR